MINFSLLAPHVYALVLPALWFYWSDIPEKRRPLFLTLLSCLFLGVAAPAFLGYILALSFIVPRIAAIRDTRKARALAYATGFATILLWKYIAGFYLATAGETFHFKILFAAVGASYLGLRVAGLLIDSCRPGTEKPSFLECLNFLSFFPAISAGPLESIKGFRAGYSRTLDRDLFLRSLYRIAFGLFKKVFLLDILFHNIFGAQIAGFTQADGVLAGAYAPAEVFILSMLLFLRALIDLSAYTDLALGFAGLFGYRIINDVNYPLMVRDLSEFWRCWHVSVMRWCQTYIYFPVFLTTKKIMLGILASLLVMGAWHNVSPKWIVWGLFQAAGLGILHYWNKAKSARGYPATNGLRRVHAVTGCVMTFAFACLAFLIIGPATLERSGDLFLALFWMK